MSKFSEKLANLGQSAPARMGFGMASAREKTPVVLVIGRASAVKAGDDIVDATLAPLASAPSESAESATWGVTVGDGDAPDAEKLKESGCQFMLVESGDCPAAALLDEDIAKGAVVESGLPDQRIRAIEDSPFEFLLYRPASISFPLTVDGMIELQELVSSFSKHIFLELAELPGESDLDILKQMPVSAIVVDMDKASADAVKTLKETVAKLEPRKHKSDRSAVVPMAGRGAVEAEADGGDYDDDDDWDDE